VCAAAVLLRTHKPIYRPNMRRTHQPYPHTMQWLQAEYTSDVAVARWRIFLSARVWWKPKNKPALRFDISVTYETLG
jgi:hypothetical protein